jgi:hypothetical protein
VIFRFCLNRQHPYHLPYCTTRSVPSSLIVCVCDHQQQQRAAAAAEAAAQHLPLVPCSGASIEPRVEDVATLAIWKELHAGDALTPGGG